MEARAELAEMDSRDFIQSIERGFAVLTAFDADAPRPTLADVARRTGFSRPAVRRILLTLQQLGYVSSANGRWMLTPRVLSIGRHYTATHTLTEIAQPHLIDLAERTSEPASLAVLDGPDIVHIADAPVRRIMSISVSIGTRAPAYPTALGRVLLAHESPGAIEDYLDRVEFKKYTPRTIASRNALRAVLDEVRDGGYSIVDEELEQGLLSASVPVHGADGRVAAALASWTIKGRWTAERMRETIVPELLHAAKAISADLGNTAGRPNPFRASAGSRF